MQLYHFEWQAISAAGTVEGEYTQTIPAPDASGAMMVFEAQNGNLAPDENGVCLVITCISWQPA